MRRLIHHTLCPYSRQVRICLKEKDLSFQLVKQNFWERNEQLAKLNPAMEVPVLMDLNNNVVTDIYAINEYLEETYKDRSLLGNTPITRAEVRRLVGWFHNKFYNEVTKYLINEKVLCFYKRNAEPNSDAIRAAKSNINYHLEYIGFLVKKHKWLAGEKISLADFAAAAQLSILDYLGDINWEVNADAKEWYSLIKSRPSFREILNDRITGFNPSHHYTNLDF